MVRNKIIILLLGIILIGGLLRFWGLGINPPSLTWDEVAWGYNAYSLGIDGRDEFGRFLPYDYLESFGDFKPPVYAYLDILPVKLFGLAEFAVRFPSALLGTLTIIITFFLTKRVFNKSQYASEYALMSSFLLAISPWHINLSRAAFEANVATFFIVTGVWLFLAGIAEKRWCLMLSAISFVLSIYTFNTARIVSPLLAVVLAIGFYKKLLERKRETMLSLLIGIILLLPITTFLLSAKASLRFQEVNIFSDIDVIRRVNQEIANDENIFWSKILHNRRFAYSVEYLRHYFDNLTPSFLFIKGDGNPKFSTQDIGQMYIWELPFLIIGALMLWKKREGYWWMIPIWLLLGIVPAATARETPHALRIETTLPTFQIIVAYGVVHGIKTLSSIRAKVLQLQVRYLMYFVLIFSLLINFLYYIHGYYTHYPIEHSLDWQYGYKDVLNYIQGVNHKYDDIFITEELGRPYIYVLFYTHYDPRLFRKTAVVEREALGFVHVWSFDKYHFGKNPSKFKPRSIRSALFIDLPSKVPSRATIVKKFNLLNGNTTLVAYTR